MTSSGEIGVGLDAGLDAGPSVGDFPPCELRLVIMRNMENE